MDTTAIGEILQDARQQRKISLDQAAGATHIRLRYLQAMETGDFEALPSRLQAKGFLRAYASYLGLDEDALIQMLSGSPGVEISTPQPEPAPRKGATAPPEGESAARFVEIGQKLRAQRELLGLSLEDIERHTHLRLRYLKALEAGDLDGLPSPVQGRGMLKNYAEFLGLSADPLLLTFADGLQAGLTRRRPETAASPSGPATPSKIRPKARFLNRDVLMVGFIVLFLLAFGIWGGMQIAALQSAAAGQAIPSPPSIAEVLLPSPSATQSPTPTPTVLAAIDEGAIITPNPVGPATENPVLILTPAAPVGPVRVQISVRERTYLRVIVDGKVELDGRVLAGAFYAFAGEEVIEIITGSGSALQVLYNEQDVGLLGSYGQAVNFVIARDGVQTPTPTTTLTPTATTTPETTPTPNP